jgi:hypothetical protein
MAHARDPAALVRDAAEAGDWRLVELIARVMSRRPLPSASWGRRVYAVLVSKLGLTTGADDYHRG